MCCSFAGQQLRETASRVWGDTPKRLRSSGRRVPAKLFAVEIDDKAGLATRVGMLRLGGVLEPVEPAFWAAQ
jgi:hypothetical protein